MKRKEEKKMKRKEKEEYGRKREKEEKGKKRRAMSCKELCSLYN
jgi:hypothetical protein